MTPHALLAPGRLAGRPVLRTQTDERLVDLVRAGSEPAFEAIVARYRRPLLRYCSRILSEERAEDAVQQTFVRAYGAMRKNSAELVLKPWLYRIAHNTALNALRDRGLRHEELPESLDGVERPDQTLERSQDLRAVVDAVQDLPERQRDAIVLRELEGRSYDEIASELGVTDGAVRQLLNRARNTLREAATALTPPGLLARVPWEGSEPVAARVAEICGAGTAGAVAAKVCATALVTGAVVSGGVAMGPDVLPGESARGDRPSRSAGVGSGRVDPSVAAPAPVVGSRGAEVDGGSEPSGSGSGGSGSGSSGSNSGQGSGSSGSGSSGSGPSGSGSGSDSSGSGSSGSGSSGSGSSGSGSGYDSSGSSAGYDSSGSGSSGSGSSGSNSGPGSGSGYSGSGTSGSGSGSSGSGSSGSGSGGSGSSGSNSGQGSGSGSSGSGSSGSGSGSGGSGSSGSGSSGSGSSGSGSDSSGSG
jgi:RNA polymerase sigma factor (sigma-70 family)